MTLERRPMFCLLGRSCGTAGGGAGWGEEGRAPAPSNMVLESVSQRISGLINRLRLPWPSPSRVNTRERRGITQSFAQLKRRWRTEIKKSRLSRR